MTDENKKSDSVIEIGESLVKSFHEQFAQNQNHHQSLFIQTLAILLSVLIGYGYLYIRIGDGGKEINITIETLYTYQVIAMALLSIAIALISNMALGFRRDQLMAANIRLRSGVMTRGSNDNYFFGSFNPQSKTDRFTWMPEFHKIFLIGLISVKMLLIYATVNYPSRELGLIFCSYPFLVNISLLSIFFDLFIISSFRRKWLKHSKNVPEYMENKEGQ